MIWGEQVCALSGVGVVWADISLGFTVSVIGATVVVAVEFFIPAAVSFTFKWSHSSFRK